MGSVVNRYFKKNINLKLNLVCLTFLQDRIFLVPFLGVVFVFVFLSSFAREGSSLLYLCEHCPFYILLKISI